MAVNVCEQRSFLTGITCPVENYWPIVSNSLWFDNLTPSVLFCLIYMCELEWLVFKRNWFLQSLKLDRITGLLAAITRWEGAVHCSGKPGCVDLVQLPTVHKCPYNYHHLQEEEFLILSGKLVMQVGHLHSLMCPIMWFLCSQLLLDWLDCWSVF